MVVDKCDQMDQADHVDDPTAMPAHNTISILQTSISNVNARALREKNVTWPLSSSSSLLSHTQFFLAAFDAPSQQHTRRYHHSYIRSIYTCVYICLYTHIYRALTRVRTVDNRAYVSLFRSGPRCFVFFFRNERILAHIAYTHFFTFFCLLLFSSDAPHVLGAVLTVQPGSMRTGVCPENNDRRDGGPHWT